MHEPRRLLIWAASNVDYSPAARKRTKPRKEYGGENWRLDPRVALQVPGLQIEDVDFYRPATKIDRGHIVRREDACWGSTAKEAEFANSDTYHWTNCTPQSQAFNQSGEHGIWGKFEEHIQREAKALDGRLCVFAGPVLGLRDPRHGYDDDNLIKVPMKFWKIVMCVSNKDDGSEPLAYAFIFDQTEAIERLGFERMDMSEYEIHQVPVGDITKKTGVQFDDSILAADVLRRGGANESLRDDKGVSITSLNDIVLR
ncbi:DNA/RNA non-specific endonuclease [Lysobacter sp. S4-A87]|nr:DNA/RNA non-specific endonuclease [Lysobacter sp. S4-A87]